MPQRHVDLLSAATLKHLREQWWDDAFTDFVKDTLQPRPGQRILDVGCGRGKAQVHLSRLRLTQVDLFAVDVVVERVQAALAATRAHNIRAGFAAANAVALPFPDATFDSTFTVAVLQHIDDVSAAIAELARVTRPDGRIVAVEPDNATRFFHSSSEAGGRAYEAAGQFFSALSRLRGDATDPSVGPKLPTLFANNGIEPLRVHLFPVSRAQLGAPPRAVWDARRTAVEQATQRVSDEAIKRLGHDYIKILARYAAEAEAAGSGFVEIQNTMLFATVGQRLG
jgi:ubiquinone/menaquinone biosynthesis C-methylase UbiE